MKAQETRRRTREKHAACVNIQRILRGAAGRRRKRRIIALRDSRIAAATLLTRQVRASIRYGQVHRRLKG